MKTNRFVLIAAMLVAGTGAFAQRRGDDSYRQKKDDQKSEVRFENTRTEARSPETKKEEVRGRESREIIYSDKKEVRYSDGRDGQNGRNSENKDYRNGRNPGDRENDHHGDSDDRRYDQGRGRANDRYDDHRRDRDDRYSGHHGNVYSYGHVGRHDEACPFCYGPRQRSGFSVHYSVQDLARLETRRLEMVLNLTERQIERIFRINLKYLTRRPGNYYDAMARREREIRSALRWGQAQVYAGYLRHLDENDLCDNCYDGRAGRNSGFSFSINF